MQKILITIAAAFFLVGCGPSDIHQAVIKGDVKSIKSFLDSDVNVNTKEKYNKTPLALAVEVQNDFNYSRLRGGFPIELSHNNHKEIVELLISKGATINQEQSDAEGETPWYAVRGEHPLYLAIESEGSLKGIKSQYETLLNMGKFTKEEYNYRMKILDGYISDYREIIKTLVDNGADVNAKGKYDLPLVDYATGHTKSLLLKLGAKTSDDIEFEESVNDPKNMKFHYSAEGGNIKAVSKYLDAGQDVNSKAFTSGGTAVHYAAKDGQHEMVKFLISKGADVNAKNGGNLTPLHYAASPIGNVDAKVAELLIDEGSDINAKDLDGETPLDYADDAKILDLLRKRGGKSGVDDSIHVAAKQGNIEAIKKHLDSVKDVNVKSDRGLTALHYAAGAAGDGHKEIAELLIARGADVNVKSEFDSTALDYAENEIADLLHKYGDKTAEGK